MSEWIDEMAAKIYTYRNYRPGAPHKPWSSIRPSRAEKYRIFAAKVQAEIEATSSAVAITSKRNKVSMLLVGQTMLCMFD